MANGEKMLPVLKIYPEQLAKRVLTCGDPWRAKRIAEKLDNMEILSEKREYWVYSGEYKGVPVTVVSHGVGSAGAAISFEELCLGGAELIIRIGTCGGLQEYVNAGDLIVATGAVREDGVTQQLVPLSYPAVADCEITNALYEISKKENIKVWKGIVLTMGAFYPGILPLANSLMAKAGVVAMENEVSALLTIASLHGVRAGAILAADGKAFEFEEDYRPNRDFIQAAVNTEINIALEAITRIEV